MKKRCWLIRSKKKKTIIIIIIIIIITIIISRNKNNNYNSNNNGLKDEQNHRFENKLGFEQETGQVYTHF